MRKKSLLPWIFFISGMGLSSSVQGEGDTSSSFHEGMDGKWSRMQWTKEYNSPLYSLQGGMDIFEEYAAYFNQKNQQNQGPSQTQLATTVGRFYKKYKPSDFNVLIIYLLDAYYEDPSLRESIKNLFQVLDYQVAADVDKARKENLAGHSAKGALNGVFILTLARMALRLNRNRITQDTAEEVHKILSSGFKKSKTPFLSFGRKSGPQKSSGGPKSRSFSQTLYKSRKWMREVLPSEGGQYIAAGIAGAGLGATLYGLKRFEGYKHPPGELLKIMNHTILAEIVIGTCEIYKERQKKGSPSQPDGAAMVQVDGYIENLKNLPIDEKQIRNFKALSEENPHSSLFPQIKDLSPERECLLEGDEPINPVALSHQLAQLKEELTPPEEEEEENDGVEKKKGSTPLHTFFQWGTDQIPEAWMGIRQWMEEIKDVGKNYGHLHRAARWGRTEMVEVLLDRGESIHTKDLQGRTALHWAVLYERKGTVQLLINRGARVDSKDVHGQTPFSLAEKSQNPEILELFPGH